MDKTSPLLYRRKRSDYTEKRFSSYRGAEKRWSVTGMAKRGIRQERKELMMEAVEALIRDRGGIAKASELQRLGLDYRRVQALVRDGFLRKVRNGYYALYERKIDEIEWIAAMFPDGVLTMETACYYYGYLDARPFQWSIAVDKNTSKSRFHIDFPAIQPYYTEPEVLQLGVGSIPFGDGIMKIYEKERLLCDLFKYEERVDRETLKSAMKGFLAEEHIDVAKLMEYARLRKVIHKVHERIGVWM